MVTLIKYGMLSRVITINFLMFTLSFAAYEQVKVGDIDSYYKDKIDAHTLKVIIKEIEDTFEGQLGQNIFDYSSNGKPIDILYLPPSKMEERIYKKIEKYNLKQEKIDALNNYFNTNKEKIDTLQKELMIQTNGLNEKINALNVYIKEQNKRRNLTKDEQTLIMQRVQEEKKSLLPLTQKQKDSQNELRRVVGSYNQKATIFNSYVNEANFLAKEIETLTRSFKKVRGKAFGVKEINIKTTIKDGEKIQEKSESISMNKIEIYGFENYGQLKAVLAHEIAHLVGIPHIEKKDALMNPIIQDNQEERLYLTNDDIENFRKNF